MSYFPTIVGLIIAVTMAGCGGSRQPDEKWFLDAADLTLPKNSKILTITKPFDEVYIAQIEIPAEEHEKLISGKNMKLCGELMKDPYFAAEYGFAYDMSAPVTSFLATGRKGANKWSIVFNPDRNTLHVQVWTVDFSGDAPLP